MALHNEQIEKIKDAQDFMDSLLAAEDSVKAMADLSGISLDTSARMAQVFILKSLGVTETDFEKYLVSDQAFEDGVKELLGKVEIDEKEEFEKIEVGENYEENPDLIVVKRITVSELLDLAKTLKIKEKELLAAEKVKHGEDATFKRERESAKERATRYKSDLKNEIERLKKEYSAKCWDVVKKVALSLCFLAIAFVLISPVVFPATALAFPANSLLAASIAAVGVGATGAGWSFATAGAIGGFSWNFFNLPACFRMLSDMKDHLKFKVNDFENDRSYNQAIWLADVRYAQDMEKNKSFDEDIAKMEATISAIGHIEDAIRVRAEESVGLMAHKRGVHLLHDKVLSKQLQPEEDREKPEPEKRHRAEPIKRKTPKVE